MGAFFLWLTVMALVVPGCMQLGNDPPPEQDIPATLPSLHEHVFAQACALSGCHTGDAPAGDLDFTTVESTRESLVNVPVVNAVASENHWVRVKPGDAQLSFLVRKLTGPGIGEGSPMPPGDSELTDYYVDRIVTWIDGGAQ